MTGEADRRIALGCELAADVAREYGEVRLKVTGCSMIPAVWPGDVIVAQRREMSELHPGQIVLCRRDGELVAHRVTRILSDHLITRGDSLPGDDQPTMEPDLLGQVVSIVRNGRTVDLRQSAVQRLGSAVVRRSKFWLRVTLRLRQYLERNQRRIGGKEISWET